jgi:putative membrane protein
MRRLSFGLSGIFTALPAFINSAAAQSPGSGYGYGPGMMWGDGGVGMFFFGPLFMIITLVAVVAAIVFLLRWLGGMPVSGPHLPMGKTALDILKERFARGEIDKAEFEERRRVLGE